MYDKKTQFFKYKLNQKKKALKKFRISKIYFKNY